jgi:hypothetical protein
LRFWPAEGVATFAAAVGGNASEAEAVEGMAELLAVVAAAVSIGRLPIKLVIAVAASVGRLAVGTVVVVIYGKVTPAFLIKASKSEWDHFVQQEAHFPYYNIGRRYCACRSTNRRAYRRIDFHYNRVPARSTWLDCSPQHKGTRPGNLEDGSHAHPGSDPSVVEAVAVGAGGNRVELVILVLHFSYRSEQEPGIPQKLVSTEV